MPVCVLPALMLILPCFSLPDSVLFLIGRGKLFQAATIVGTASFEIGL